MLPLALAPFGLSSPWLFLAIGAAFGAVLERSGFGDSRRLAAQFYFTETRVLRVMFTAIVTCLLLLTAASTLGVLDFRALAIPPTYLSSALLGGLLLGVGFVVGGYCPGTSIVSAATGKVDGMFFLGGVAVGVFAFGETADGFRTFWDRSGAMGVVTLPDVLRLPFGAVVAGVVLMALGMFALASVLERRIGRVPVAPRGGRAAARGPRALRAGALAALLVALVGLARPATGAGSAAARVELLAPALDAELAAGTVRADPLEVLGLLHHRIGGAPARFRLVVLDVRPEADFNRFHLLDAERTTLDALRGEAGRALAGPAYTTAVKVLVSNDGRDAVEAWRLLRAHGARHAYVLDGGVNLWLDVFRDGRTDARATDDGERLRHAFPSALGARHPFARPPLALLERLLATKARSSPCVVRPVTKAAKASGGCG